MLKLINKFIKVILHDSLARSHPNHRSNHQSNLRVDYRLLQQNPTRLDQHLPLVIPIMDLVKPQIPLLIKMSKKRIKNKVSQI